MSITNAGLTELLDTLTHDYAHMPSASGFGIQAAAVVATAAGRPADAITLLTGSRRHGLHRRYEGATALGRAYLHRARRLLSSEEADAAASRGEMITLTDLLALAREVAADIAPV